MAGKLEATVKNTAKGRRTGKIPEWRAEDFRAIVTKNADGMIVLDREGYVLYVNPAAESLFKLTSIEMVGARFGFPIMPNQPVDICILREFKDVVAAEMRLVEVIWAGEPSYLLSFRDLTDRIIAEQAMSQARDNLDVMVKERTRELSEYNEWLKHEISERKHAEEERELLLKQVDEQRKKLEESVKIYRAIGEMIPFGIWICGLDGGVLYYSQSYLDMAGMTFEELKEFGWSKQLPPEDVERTIRDWKECIAHGEFWKYEHYITSADGKKHVILSRGVPIKDEEGKTTCWAGINLDITDLKEKETELAEAKAQAELYIDLMSHDINNMNQSAMGYLELALGILETEKRLRQDDRMLIERPMCTLASSSTLIDNVRKLQRLMTEGVKTMPTDLNKIFQELEAMNFHSQDRDVLINIQHVSGITVKANELLKDVFVNLITNAIKHSDEEKPLTVNVAIEPINENDRGYYKCVVEDNGPGIPDELKGKLFHRFQRGTTKAHGKGLGLYLVRTLIEGYGGKVWAEDRVHGDYKKGARFVVLLPAAE